jgi:hypothetical protein
MEQINRMLLRALHQGDHPSDFFLGQDNADTLFSLGWIEMYRIVERLFESSVRKRRRLVLNAVHPVQPMAGGPPLFQRGLGGFEVRPRILKTIHPISPKGGFDEASF